jgi:hypothetical protein
VPQEPVFSPAGKLYLLCCTGTALDAIALPMGSLPCSAESANLRERGGVNGRQDETDGLFEARRLR